MSRLYASLPDTGRPDLKPQQAVVSNVRCLCLSVLLEELPLPPEDKTAIQCPENMGDLYFTGMFFSRASHPPPAPENRNPQALTVEG